jgi:hypothetical protein
MYSIEATKAFQIMKPRALYIICGSGYDAEKK